MSKRTIEETFQSVKPRGSRTKAPTISVDVASNNTDLSASLSQAGQASFLKAGLHQDTSKHSCKGKNDCKGQGGCKASDNGCKGKNSCKGKGGCATDGSKPHLA